MKILLIGNYFNDHQKSMLLFAEMLKEGLISIGCEVELIVPQVFFGKPHGTTSFFGKPHGTTSFFGKPHGTTS